MQWQIGRTEVSMEENTILATGQKIFIFEKPAVFEATITGQRHDINGAYYASSRPDKKESRLYFTRQIFIGKDELLNELKDEVSYLNFKIKELEQE
jgi:hypothetical protein